MGVLPDMFAKLNALVESVAGFARSRSQTAGE
jgi:hypothetical protein